MANIEPALRSAAEQAENDRLGRMLLGAIGAAIATGIGGSDYGELKDRFRRAATKDPIDTLLATVLGGGALFHLLERGKNPRCNTYWDSVLYVATSLSVGYDDVFPKTPAGNAVAALVQSFGPALAAGALSPPAADSAAATQQSAEVQRQILTQLEEIATLLRAQAAARDGSR